MYTPCYIFLLSPKAIMILMIVFLERVDLVRSYYSCLDACCTDTFVEPCSVPAGVTTH